MLHGLIDRLFPPEPESPCRKICRIDMTQDLCVGCWRRRDEIAAWRSYSRREKRALLAQLPAREQAYRSGDAAP
ncbi:DUF1289 domain-containing protein [Sphingomonas azotifigens]|uniref:DUF1289 domain-containing protein n=1 Tax=Sphingomonas azotifigens TaxID=330920 RepID=UPI000A00D83A|nr:DUF1289 domain-containing protein [Sphingomonas azotifigens]